MKYSFIVLALFLSSKIIYSQVNSVSKKYNDSIYKSISDRQYKQLNKSLAEPRRLRDSIEHIINNPKSTKPNIKLANKEYDKLYQIVRDINIKNILDFPNSIYSIQLIYDLRYQLGFVEVKRLFHKLDDNVKSSINAEKLNRFINLFGNHIDEGDRYIDFEQKNNLNKTVKLSELLKKYTVIHFWSPKYVKSSENNLKLRDLYSNLKTKDLEIIGYALTKNKVDWKETVEKYKIPWPQLIDLNGWDSEIGFRYGVNLVSRYCLIDKKGNIIYNGKDIDKLKAIVTKKVK